jgi:hypothetical protein
MPPSPDTDPVHAAISSSSPNRHAAVHARRRLLKGAGPADVDVVLNDRRTSLPIDQTLLVSGSTSRTSRVMTV